MDGRRQSRKGLEGVIAEDKDLDISSCFLWLVCIILLRRQDCQFFRRHCSTLFSSRGVAVNYAVIYYSVVFCFSGDVGPFKVQACFLLEWRCPIFARHVRSPCR
ncbi:unnamed protein product, partial [Ectocarpus fasciculatus]